MKYLRSLMVLILLPLLTGCGKQTQITNLSMLEGGKTIAVPTGTAADVLVLKRFPDAQLKYYNSVLDCALAVKGGKADATVYDLPVLQNILAKNDGLTLLPELMLDDEYGFGVQLTNTELKNAIDLVVDELKASGKYQEMLDRWLPKKGSPAAMPEFKLDGTNGVLRFGTAAVTEPMSFVDGSRQVVGFDVEMAYHVAQKMGMQVEVINMDFGAMLPALIAGKVDMIGSGLSITEERKKSILFSNSYYKGGLAVAVREVAENGKATDNEQGKLRTLDDIADKNIGVLLGSVYDKYASQTYPNAKVQQFQTQSDLLISLQTKKIDCLFTDQSTVPDLLAANPEFGMLVKDVFFVPIGAGFNSENDALREQFNAFLKEIRGNGVYSDMTDRWMVRAVDSMPDISLNGSNGVLKAGVVNDLGRPYGFVQDGILKGFDIELSMRFAAYCGKKYEPVALPFGSLIASISTNKIDIITASMFITEEREKQIDFSDPYSESGASVMARKSDLASATGSKMAKLEDVADKRIGVFTGTIHDGYVTRTFPKAKILRYEGSADMVLSLETGKIDAAMMELAAIKRLLQVNPRLGLLADNLMRSDGGVGFSKNNPALRQEFNAYLKEIRADGTYDKMFSRWFIEDPEKAVMPEISLPTGGKKITAGVSVDDLPYVAYVNGEFVGFDIELIRTFAQRRGYQLEFNTLEFASLVAALAAGKADLVTDGMAITEERSKQIDFSDPYIEFNTGIFALKSNLAAYTEEPAKVEKKPLAKRVAESFQNNIILEKRYLLIIDGLIVTILISLFSALIGTIIGGIICWMKMSGNKILTPAANIYISLLRGTPVLVLLMIIYYIVFASVNINPVVVAVFAFGLNFGAYVSEMFRTSIESIDKGQSEAGTAGGFTKVQTFLHIITPQAMRHLLPVYKGEFISLVKMTSIVGYIAVEDLTKASDIIRSRTFDAFFPLLMAAVIYLILSWLLTWALGKVEISVDPKRKRIKRVEEAIR